MGIGHEKFERYRQFNDKENLPKFKYRTDTADGIRTITQIRNLPMGELTDEEVCKLFFDRFDAEALVMVYVDKEGQEHIFGRLRKKAKWVAAYRRLLHLVNRVSYFWNWKTLSE